MSEPVDRGTSTRTGQHAGTDTGSSTAESADRVVTNALAGAHTHLGNAFLAHSPVFGADLSVGMGMDVDLAGIDPATALIQQHTMGAVALAMAGFESADLVPGAAPLSVMRQLMRRGSQAEAEGLDTDKAAGRIGSRGGAPLPEAVRVRMERAFGHDFSHVRVHTDGGAAQAADALHAMAFAIGRDIYFGRGAWRPGTPAGDELLAHELTHVVQADEGRLPSAPSGGGMDVSNPNDPHEREAVSMGRKVAQQLSTGSFDAPAVDSGLSEVAPAAAMDSAGPVTEAAGATATATVATTEGPASDAPAASEAISADSGAVASRDTTTTSTPTTGTSTSSPTSSADTQGAGESAYATLMIAGKEVQVRVPASEGQTATVEVPMDRRPVEGLHLTSALLNLDAEGVVVGGTVRGKLEVEGFFEGTQVSLGILPGGQIAPSVKDVPIKVGPAQGKMDLEVNEAGISGRGEIQAHDLGLPQWLGIQGGALEIAFGAGQVTGTGLLQGTQTARGTATAELKLTDTTLETKITYVVTPGLEPVPRIRIENATLTGTMVKDLGDSNLAETPEPWSGSTEGGAVEAPATEQAPAATNTPSNHKVYGEGLSATDDIFAVATGGRKPPANQFQERANRGGGSSSSAPAPAPATQSSSSSSSGATTAAPAPAPAVEAPAARDPNAFLLEGRGRVVVADWVTGDLQLRLDPATGTFDASGVLSAENEKSFGEVLTVKSEVSLQVDQNVPTQAKAKLDFVSEQYKLKGKITGDYDIQASKVDGKAVARTTHHIPFEGEYGRIRILKDSKVEGEFRDNALHDLYGKLKMDADLQLGSDTPLQVKGQVDGTYDHRAGTVVGSAQALTQADFILPVAEGASGAGGGEGGGVEEQFVLLKDSVLNAEMKDTKFDNVTMDAKLRYDRGGEAFLLGSAEGCRWDIQTGQLSGEGTFTLMKSLERSTKGGEWTLRLMEGSEVTAKVEANSLKEIGGDITVQVDDAKGPLANGIVQGAVVDVGTWETSGVIKLTTARKFFHPGEGQTLANGYGLEVLPGSGINGTITKDVLTDVGADLRTMITDEEGSLARLRLQAELDLETNEVDGKGTLSLAREFVVAENLAGQGWTAKVLRGTKAEGHIKDNEFTKVTGALKAGILDEQGKFIEATGTGEWTTADDLFDLVGTITVSREKVLADGGEGGWSIALVPGETTATATIEDDVFQGISGTISTMVRRAGEDFAKLGLEGTWNETDGFKGAGDAELLVDIDVAGVGEYNLWVTKGTGAHIALDNGGVKEIGGKVPMRLDKGDAQFIKGNVEGTYKLDEKLLNGSGSAEVLVEEELGRLGDDQLWIVKGSGATITLVDNELTELGGQLNLSVRNGEGEYAKVALQGTFDAKGGTGFSGTGGVTVTRDNQLFAVDNYSFWLKQGTGATAHIKENTLEKIDGQVPFMVKDGGPEPLIQGSVNGVYDPTTGHITGNGAVYLGRTLEYDMGGGVVLKLLQGSGGDADVKESQLQRLGGTLTAEIWKDGEGMVRVTADGEYNVVHNTLTRLEGSATLLKPISVADGNVLIQNVEGHATIENNQLVACGGSGEIVVVPLNNMKGTFEVEWSNIGGVEKYEGKGWLEFTLIDRDPNTGRGMGGLVYAEVQDGGKFMAAGEVNYDINEAIGGTLQVQVDDKLDPLLYGDIMVDTDLVDARELFGIEQDIVPEQTVRLPYGLALFYGMKGGMAMGMNALHLDARIAVGNWRPLSENAAVPSFETGIHMNWGMNLKAMIAPYLGIGGDIGVASAQMGVRGEVSLNAPLEVRAGGMLKGDSGGFYGELAVGLGFAANVDLALIPYIKGEVLEMFSFEEDLDRFEQPLGEIFSFEWGGKYIFGDTTRKENAPIERLDIPQPTRKDTKIEGKPELGIGNGGGAASNKKGGPQIESGSEIAGGQSLGHGDMAEVMETVNDVIAVIEALGAAGELAGMILSALAALASFGPAGLIVHIVWGIFKGDLSWDRIKTAVEKLIEGIRAAGRLLRKHMPGWWNAIQDVFSGEKPGLLDALFGADDRMREAVGRGDHRYAPYDLHKEMVNTMKGGWLSTADANCIAQVFEVAAQQGHLARLVADCGGADDFIDGWSTGFDDSAIKRVFDRNGIRY
jgi:hypothetical protein